MGEPSEGMSKVTRKSWWTTSRLASSTSGMRWPIPGVGTMATWGGSCWECCIIQGEGKQWVFRRIYNIYIYIYIYICRGLTKETSIYRQMISFFLL
jgi:hypothetical protein